MAKLTKSEISALVSKISDQVNTPKQEENRIAKEEAEQAFCKLPQVKEFETLFKIKVSKIENASYDHRNAFRLLKSIYGKEATKKQLVSNSVIEQEVILAGIDTANVQELVDLVVKNLNNK